MSTGEYLEGLALLALMLAGVGVGSVLLQRRRLPGLRGALLVVVLGLLATLGLLAVHVVPLALGVLSRWSVLAATALWAAACLRVPRAATPAAPEPGDPAPDSRAGLALAAVAVAGVVAYLLAVVRDRLDFPATQIDIMAFHLPGVARWMQTGSLWQIDTLLPDVSPGHYPNNGDVVMLAGVLPFEHDFLAHLTMVPFFALTGVALYALARELRVSRAASALAAAAVLAMPVVAVPALASSLVDILMLFGFAAGLLFLLRHHRAGRTADLVLGGLALGVAFGTKWYGVSAVAVVLAVWAGARLLAHRPWRTVAGEGAALCGLVGLSGGIWFVRNLVESANPVFPVEVSPLGVTIFDAPTDVFREGFGFTLADYLGDWDVWSDAILPQLRDTWAAPSLVLLAGLAAGTAWALARRRGAARADGRGAMLAGAVLGVLLLVVYFLLPYTAGGPEGQPLLVAADARYGVPALVVGAVMAAWAADRVRGGVAVLGVLVLVSMVHALDKGSAGTLGAPELTRREWATAILVTVVLAAAGLAAARLWPRLARTPRAAVLAAVAVAAAAVVVVGGDRTQERFTQNRYAGLDPALDALQLQAPEDRRVGLAGLWTENGPSPVLPAFGPRYDNEVEFIGRWVEETIRRHTDQASFVRAVRDGGYDFVVVGRGRDANGRPEERWIQAAGYALVTQSERLGLYQRG